MRDSASLSPASRPDETQEHVDRSFRIARWYGRQAHRAQISDLESAALEGLAKAAHDWTPEHDGVDRCIRGERSFWSFAFVRIVGEMRDELRRLDHLTRDQRAKVVQCDDGEPALRMEGLDWIDPNEPVSLDASVAAPGGHDSCALVDLIQEPNDPIEAFELRDAVARAGAALPARTRFVFVTTEVEGLSNPAQRCRG